jgi:nitrate/nitrite transport system permease protein
VSESGAVLETDPFGSAAPGLPGRPAAGPSRAHAERSGRARLRAGAVRAGRPFAAAAAGFAALVGFWALVTVIAPDLPTPWEGFRALGTMLSSPFHDNGGTDLGIGLQLWTSLQRVFIGFGIATAIAVPVGFLMGSSKLLWSAINPVVQLLRPVSPLAWFPIGLVVFKSAPHASTFVILVTALWPTVINTAFGVASVPQDHSDVARVFRFSRWKRIRYVTAPYSLPSILTGMRISMGIAWMVIVAVEMMSGSTGIGFFVWDAYNAGNLSNVIAAILLIGAVGVVLDLVLHKVHGLTTHEENH